MEHLPGYYIAPHIDQKYLLATALLYCPSDNLHTHLSTVFFKHKNTVSPMMLIGPIMLGRYAIWNIVLISNSCVT